MTTGDAIALAYRRRTNVRLLFILACGLIMVAMAIVSLCVGASGMSMRDVVAALFADSGRAHGIVWMLRLPRIVLAILVGFGLGMAGAVFQAILRNPLASPYTLGVGSGAGFGAVTVIIFVGGMHRWAVAGGAFACAMFSAGVILAVARMRQASTETMILGGIAQMFLFSSLTSLSLMTAGCICFAGVIGFIGLVAPHIRRMIIGGDHRYLLPASGLVGAVVVLLADTLGRTLWSPQVLPIGIVTSFIGVPFFFYLLLKQKKAYW